MKNKNGYMKQTSVVITKTFFVVLLLVAMLNASAQDDKPKQRTISANGLAEAEVTPDEIYVQVELREYDKKGAGKIDIEQIKNNFLKACKEMGLADTDVVVQSYQGWDGNYWWYKKNKKQNPDMKAGITYWVKVSTTKKMDELVDKMDDEATQNFFIAQTDYSKKEALKKQLKIEAVKAAKAKADYLAAAINENVGEAITINDPDETGNNYPRPMFANTMLKTVNAEDQSAPAMNVDFKKIKYQFQVNVVFALK